MTVPDASEGPDEPSVTPHPVEGLEVTEVEDGLVVYDPERDRVHYLNAVASVVFVLCDGARERDQVVEASTKIFGSLSASDIEACLAQLENERILRAG